MRIQRSRIASMAPARRLSTVGRHLRGSSASSSNPSSSSPSSPSPSPSAMSYRSPVTSHVLDTSRGLPAANMRVELQRLEGSAWLSVGVGVTNSDGRVQTPLVPQSNEFRAGTYRVVFDTQAYFEATGVREFFYPSVEIAFIVKDPSQHFHVPLLINPFGYSTYRGS